jgi:hypothetical protein
MFLIEDMEPKAFHPYTSSVYKRIWEVDVNDAGDYFQYKKYLLDMFNDAGIKCQDDNKIVFEMEFNGKRIFYGFYDGVFSVGFEVRSW